MRFVNILDQFKLSERSFTSSDIQKIFGLANETVLTYWRNENLLIPSVSDARGRGKRRIYNFEDVIVAGIIHFLLRHGFSHKNIRELISITRRKLPEIMKKVPVPYLVLVLQIGYIRPGDDLSADCIIIDQKDLKEIWDEFGHLRLEDSEPELQVQGHIICHFFPIVSKILAYLS